MLTDNCGIDNSGIQSGPQMKLLGTSFTVSQSVQAGKAATFSDSSMSSGFTAASGAISSQLGTKSLTLMLWVDFSSLDTNPSVTLMEVGQTNKRGLTFALQNGGLYYNFGSDVSGCTANCATTAYTFKPTLNTWYHLAFVYDATVGAVKIYLNSSAVSTYQVGSPTNLITW